MGIPMDAPSRLSHLLAGASLGMALLGACGDRSGTPASGAPSDAGAMVRPADLGVAPAAPSPEGDGRLVDLGDSPLGTGWDLCHAQPPLTATPPAGPAGPSATRGSRYLLSGPDRTTDASVGVHTPQAYLWMEKAGTARGLWLDLVLISGAAAQSRFSIYRTDAVCNVQQTLATADLQPLLASAGVWRTLCMDLTTAGEFTSLGIRLDSPQGRIGLDALRLGPACPD